MTMETKAQYALDHIKAHLEPHAAAFADETARELADKGDAALGAAGREADLDRVSERLRLAGVRPPVAVRRGRWPRRLCLADPQTRAAARLAAQRQRARVSSCASGAWWAVVPRGRKLPCPCG